VHATQISTRAELAESCEKRMDFLDGLDEVDKFELSELIISTKVLSMQKFKRKT